MTLYEIFMLVAAEIERVSDDLMDWATFNPDAVVRSMDQVRVDMARRPESKPDDQWRWPRYQTGAEEFSQKFKQLAENFASGNLTDEEFVRAKLWIIAEAEVKFGFA